MVFSTMDFANHNPNGAAMNFHRSYCPRVLTMALVLAGIGNTKCFAETTYELTPYGREQVGTYLHYTIFGNNGPETWIFGPKQTYTGWPPRRVTPQRVARRVTPSQTSRFDTFNLLVNLPSGPWVKLDPKETGSRACLLMSRSNPTIVISLAAERVGIEANESNSSLLATSQAKMKSLPEGDVVPGERKLSANGIEGVSYESSAVVENGTMVHYSIWVATHNGYKYSLAVYGEQKDKPAIDETMHSFLRGIKQIEPARVARTDARSRRG